MRWLALGLLLLAGAAQAAGCASDRIDRRADVAHVIDGDTLVLADGEHLRLIGVNTPELAHDSDDTHRPAEPLAVEARDRLRLWLARAGNRLGLRYDAERRDRYGRLLAHAFTSDGESVSAWLLRRGLGHVLVVPPNDWHLDCLVAVQAEARRAGRGLWGDPGYKPRPSRYLAGERDTARGGLLRVQGPVVRIGRGGGALWLNLPGQVAVRIPEADLGRFRAPPADRLLGRSIEVIGRFYPHRGELRLQIHDPAQLWVVD